MWLDRFSQTTSNPSSNTPSRYHSPGPRRSSQLTTPNQRNGLGIGLGRTGSNASLDLTSPNASNSSLPLLQRRQTGSGLKQEQRLPLDAADPLDVLQQLVGPSVQHKSLTNGENTDLRDVEITFDDLGLEEYLERDLSGDEESITSIQQEETMDSSKYEDLHTSITDVDQTLQSIETYLTNFKAELGQVSAEIETLQARSVNLNAQLDNRRKVEKLLGPAVEDVSISPHTVRAIAGGPIDETFAKALTEIEARSLTVNNKNVEIGHTKAAEDVTPLLQDLKLRAVERIRDHLVSQIKALRSPNINAQVVQQQSFLKHKELYPFLARNHPQLAEEIAQAYTNTIRWYYSSNFTRYQAALTKLSIHHFDQNDLLGSDPSAKKQSVLSAAKITAQYDPFSLGRRADYLKSNDDKALPSHLAEDSKLTSYLEVPFRNFNQVLLDNLTVEYTVITDLFSTATYHQVSKRVATIFEPTFALGHGLTKSLVENTTDTLGILICIRLTQQYAFETQKRKLPVMDDYINYTNILLWPRFQKAMDLHVESLKKTPTSANRGAAAAFSLVGGANAGNSVAPHAITQRFGQFLSGILTLSATAGDDEPLAHSLARLRSEYETLMGKLAKGAGDAGKRNRFLFNNYSLVLTIISESTGKLGEEQKEYFGTLVRDLKSR